MSSRFRTSGRAEWDARPARAAGCRAGWAGRRPGGVRRAPAGRGAPGAGRGRGGPGAGRAGCAGAGRARWAGWAGRGRGRPARFLEGGALQVGRVSSRECNDRDGRRRGAGRGAPGVGRAGWAGGMIHPAGRTLTGGRRPPGGPSFLQRVQRSGCRRGRPVEMGGLLRDHPSTCPARPNGFGGPFSPREELLGDGLTDDLARRHLPTPIRRTQSNTHERFPCPDRSRPNCISGK